MCRSDASTSLELPPGVTRYTLGNGLTVILQENHAAPVLALDVWVRVGSGDERDEESGIAHVHEHMLFKGTSGRGVGDIAREVEGSGGNINAYTSYDQTVYYIVIASRYCDTAIDVLADAVQNSVFDPSELAKEEEVIVEEIRRGEDSPGGKLYRNLFENAYSAHSYRRPIIGTEAHVRSFTREMILDFYRRWYVPSNMALVVVGDFKTEHVRHRIAQTFGAASARPPLMRHRDPEPPRAGLRCVVVPDNVQQGYLQMAFNTCNLQSSDAAALDILAIVLGQGESSRLYRRVKADQRKVHDVRAYSYLLRDPGLFFVSALIDPHRALDAQTAMLREVFRLREQPLSHAELRKAKINIEADTIYDKETVQGQAQKLGFYESVAEDLGYEAEYLRRVLTVTPEEVMSVARRYFQKDLLSIAHLLPPGAAGAIDERAIRAAADAAHPASRPRPTAPRTARVQRREEVRLPELTACTGEGSDHPIERVVLPNGVTLVINESHAVPVVALRAVMLGGSLMEDRNTCGISDFIANMLTKGTRRRSASRIAEEIERIAGTLQSHSGRNSLSVEMEVLSRHLEQGLGLLADILLNPTFDSMELQKQRADTLAAIRRREDDLAGLTVDTFAATLFLRHPYRFATLGTARTVKRFTPRQLRAAYARLAVPSNLVIAVVGDVHTQDVVGRLRRKFGGMRPRSFRRPPTPIENVPEKTRLRVVHKEKAQAHLMVGFPGTTLTDPDKYAIEVMNTVLAGQGGRLFVELRDRLSLAYTVTSFSLEGVDPGYMAVYMGTGPEKLKRALAGVRRELARIRREGITADELDRARRYLVGSYEIDLQRSSAQAATLAFNERYGLGVQEYRAYPEKILAVTAEEVLRAARKYLRIDRPVIALVRPAPGRSRRRTN